MSTNTPQINTRQPTACPSWPLFLVEGPEKVGKSYLAAQLTASNRFSRSFWVDWGEGSADEYGAMPGASYEVVIHDSTFKSVANQIYAIHQFALQQQEAGEPPVLLVVDSMTAEWEALKEKANRIAIDSPSGQRKLERDPGADVTISWNVWNKIHERHGRLMRLLMTFPGVVVMTARGKEVAEIGENGKPVEGSKVYKVEGHRNLAFDASVVIRLSRDDEPKIVGMRSLNHGIRPGKDKAQPLGKRTLEDLTWDVLFKDAEPTVRDVASIETRAPEQGNDQAAEEQRAIQSTPEPDPGPQQSAESGNQTQRHENFEQEAKSSDRSKWDNALEKSRGDLDMLNQLYASAVSSFGESHEFTTSVDVALREAQAAANEQEAEQSDEDLVAGEVDYGEAVRLLESAEEFDALVEYAEDHGIEHLDVLDQSVRRHYGEDKTVWINHIASARAGSEQTTAA